jgi:hypothetical protein
MGYRDCYFWTEKEIMFTITADCNVVSRLDSYFTNMNLPWDKKKLNKEEVVLSVGMVEAWQATKVKGDFSYERLWIKNFKS